MRVKKQLPLSQYIVTIGLRRGNDYITLECISVSIKKKDEKKKHERGQFEGFYENSSLQQLVYQCPLRLFLIQVVRDIPVITYFLYNRCTKSRNEKFPKYLNQNKDKLCFEAKFRCVRFSLLTLCRSHAIITQEMRNTAVLKNNWPTGAVSDIL